MNALSLLEILEKTPSTSEKVKLLNEYRSDELCELLDAALNFKRKFFIKKFDEFDTSRPTKQHRDIHEAFKSLLYVLENRQATGHQALDLVQDFFSGCTEFDSKWYGRILRKDLRCGVDISTCRKADIDIPEFDVMLAKDGKDNKKAEHIIKSGVYLSPKLDGYRCIAICDNGEVILYSRNGSEYNNFPTVIESLQKWCQGMRFVLDGEIMSNDFNQMQQSAFASKRGTTVGDVKYHVFGFIPMEEWTSDDFKLPTEYRLKNLTNLFERYAADNIVLVPQKLVTSLEAVSEYERECTSKGYEGVMALPNIPYYRGRKTNRLMKFKTMLSQDCKVLSVYEGEGRNENRLGGFTVQQENGEFCDVGSGFTDEDREYIWKNPDSVIHRTAEIKYQELTPDGVMRFPIFMRWRDDK